MNLARAFHRSVNSLDTAETPILAVYAGIWGFHFMA